jgi:hypothetical protein
MSRRAQVLLVLLALIALCASLRLVALEHRPPHHDEGVNGWFVEKIQTDGYYAYDPSNYHGPSYFYLLTAARETLGFGLWQLRLPGALVGIALCLLPLGLGGFVSGRADPVVRAEQIELLNPAGARQAVLRANSAGVVLMLFGPRGKPVSALQLGDSALTLLDAAGQPVATLGGPGVKHLVE